MTKKIESISLPQAQKLVLLSQRVLSEQKSSSAKDATLAAIEHLGYIQIDTISAIQRAHHHTLWNRNHPYQASHLDDLVADKKVFEHWSHAAAYLPMRDYRFSLVRKKAIASGLENHWYERDTTLMNEVLKRITAEGPLMAKDFEHKATTIADWGSKPAKRALEYLFMQGELMITKRVNFHKVYDLTERVLPENTNTTFPTNEEYARFLITRYLQANGLGIASEMAYLIKNTKTLVSRMLQQMLSDKEVIEIKVNDSVYFALPKSLELLNNPLSKSKLRILSPFDNVLIQRKRMQALFNFDYQIECYVTAAKRQYGYFSLPVLWDGKFVARMDCKADRKSKLFHINHLAMEDKTIKTDAFIHALTKELKDFLVFNECTTIQLHKTTPNTLKPILEDALKKMH
ncbi:winged helix-turn-helix domain-containing protein [Labilibacter marinus]|uniref:winged helix-turn-helix domain-containing protein n=1 Tax=Labilibacter marinus TaxID=1477105 RepID=UPI000A70A1F6|nr:crosslink repair DNA glycosylase YcaQ family protein [Labilibacter marinus]